MTKRWFCLHCKKFVDTYIDIFKGFALSCESCGSSRIIQLDKIDSKKFKRLVEEFKDRTGRV